MRSAITSSLLVACALAPAVALAQPPDPYARLFPFEADVAIERPGVHLVPLDAEVVREVRPGLDDLRLVGRDGAEIPWLVEGDVPERPSSVDTELLPIHVTRSEEWLFDTRETFVVELPALPPGVDAWDLDLRSSAPRFVQRVVVEALDAAGRPTRILYEGSIFRLEHPLRERTRVPVATGPGRVRVTLEAQEGRHLGPDLHAIASRPRVAPEELVIELAIENVRHERGVTIVTLARPRGIVPTVLRIDAAASTFHRPVVVRDVGPGSERPELARTAIWRVSELASEELEIELARARGETIELELTDGDTPPLEGLVVRAVVRRPILVADLLGPATLRYGGGRAHRPVYDLAGLVRVGEARRLLERGIPFARVSRPRPCPHHEPAPALGFAMRPGAPVEAHEFSHSRAVRVGGAPEGLSRIRLTPAETARARADLGDLRVVDAEGRQWPYLLERAASVARVEIRPTRTVDGALSRFVIELPDSPLPVIALELESDERYVDRDFRVRGRLGDEWRALERGRLVRRPDRGDPLRIALATRANPARVEELVIEMTDGGDAPLEVTRAVVEVEVADLYLAAPEGSYRLLVGNSNAEAPHYELTRARGLALAVPAHDVERAELVPNPDWAPTRDVLELTEIALWIVLAIAVLFLAWLSLRLARSEAPNDEPTPPEPGETGAPGPSTPDDTPNAGAPP